MTKYSHSSLAVLILAAFISQAAAEPPPAILELSSDVLAPGVSLKEAARPVSRFQITVRLDKNGNGSGTLLLDANTPRIDEFGTTLLPTSAAPTKLDCVIKFVKKGRVQEEAGPPPEEWLLYQITGPKITTRLFIATPGPGLTAGRLIVWQDAKTVAAVVPLVVPPSPETIPALPCHPGCFPAGTAVAVPGGIKAIEGIQRGDEVITVGPSGASAARQVADVFVTRNRLLEVRTDAGLLKTTETQPLCLVNGEFRSAGELKAGDRIWQWAADKRREVVVQEVTPPGKEVQVFNLVIGDQVVFIAGGFLARGKPPKVTAEPSVVSRLLPASK